MSRLKTKLILLALLLVLTAGCNGTKKTNSGGIKETDKNIIEETKDMTVLNCSREATAGTGIDVDLKYKIYYTGQYIEILHSVEKITSENQESLDEYETAYKNISENYKGLKYYDTTVTRDKNTVINDTTINYGKIDIDKLLEIEGEEDNIIKDGKVKVADWVEFAEKFGTTCVEN